MTNSDAAASDAAASDPELSPSEQVLAQVTAERDDYLDQLQRLTADYQNFKRRSADDLQTKVNRGVSNVIEALLPVLDACDAAALQGSNEGAPIAQALLQALEKVGLERINSVGAVFDPNEHEAISQVDSTATTDSAATGPAATGPASAAASPASTATGPPTEQIVLEEFRTGYRFNGQMLRAPMVKVGTRGVTDAAAT